MQAIIIEVCEDTPTLAMSLASAGCRGVQAITSAVQLHLTQVTCREYIHDVCGEPSCDSCEEMFNYKPISACIDARPEPVSIIYPAIGTTDEGLIEFRFDDKLFQSPPGRYTADVYVQGCLTTSFDIDLCSRRLNIEKITITAAQSCLEG